MAIKGKLVARVDRKGKFIRLEDPEKTPYVRLFGKLKQIKKSEISQYEEAGMKIEWL